MLTLITCNKTKEMKNKLFPERPYEEASINKFYWVDSDNDYKYIPLILPYKLVMSSENNQKWTLTTNSKGIRMVFDDNVVTIISSIEPITDFNISSSFIYGISDKLEHSSIPKLWFIYNTMNNNLKLFEKEEDFKAELKKLDLPEKFLTPDDVFEQYQNDPILPWFPENIKKQLEEVKVKKK